MTDTQETVGFIGIGLMGHGMAKNIVEKGYPLTVIAHRNRVPLGGPGGKGWGNRGCQHRVDACGKSASVIFLCLTGAPRGGRRGGRS